MYEDELKNLRQAKNLPLAREIGSMTLVMMFAVGLLPVARYVFEQTRRCNKNPERKQIENYGVSPMTRPYIIATRPSD